MAQPPSPNKAAYPPDRTPDEAISLFKALEAKFPSATLGDDRWYFIPIAALVGSGQPEFAIQLYTYLISKPEYSTPQARQELVRRLREALVKCVPIVGVCRPLEVVFGISKIEREEDKDYSFSRLVIECPPPSSIIQNKKSPFFPQSFLQKISQARLAV
ncbi:predicted protein [Uncinocarpus reesii 1704]|uniref:Uncharacterized protein n=1 Tax=Uncinocarpus reesii (strain UAMH 1704) TaxID=336963 RepID=C4JNE2_UNCRE|nr:uncharacterized protein UREG_04348 [Uncinocarpus reesii 1704]EEP79502.1 predicted protein [Uncinocarpus reesii 1704]